MEASQGIASTSASPLPDETLPDEIYESALDLLLDLCRRSSPSDDLDGLNGTAQAAAEAFAALDLAARVESMEVDGAKGPVVLAGESGTPLLVVGHLDTVLPAIEPEVDGQRLRGTGSVDMKAGLVAFWGALAWRRRTGKPAPAFRLLIVPDEEIGGPISTSALRREASGIRRLWCLEPGGMIDGTETLVAARRGLYTWTLDAVGASAHTGPDFSDGRSALLAAAEWCAAAATLTDLEYGPTVNVSRLVAGDRDLVESKQWHLIASPHRLNVVPDRALAEGEIRFVRLGQAEKCRSRLVEAAERIGESHGVELHLEITDRIPALPPTADQLAAAQRAAQLSATRGRALILETDRHGISLPNLLPDPSRVEVLDGLGPVGGGMHTRDEWVSLESLRRRIELLADLLDELEPKKAN